jgi:isoleucyl-tRNA synthetase
MENVVSPQKIAKQMGIDILRLWVVGCDYSEDVRISQETLRHQQDLYRRVRNTFRYLLGALDGFDNSEKVDIQEMPELEKWILHRLRELDQLFRKCNDTFNFQFLYSTLHNFCALDLSAFYFDIRKDSLYCDDSKSLNRRSARTVMDLLFNYLVKWFAPVICFTTEEAWLSRFPDKESIHLETIERAPSLWNNSILSEKYIILRKQRRVLTGALEIARANGHIKSSLQAHITIYDPKKQLFTKTDWGGLAITSSFKLSSEKIPKNAYSQVDSPDIGVVVDVAKGDKCQRCWKVSAEVGSNLSCPDLCHRCMKVIGNKI